MLVRLNKPYCTFEQLQPAPVHKVKTEFYLNRNRRSNVGNNYTD